MRQGHINLPLHLKKGKFLKKKNSHTKIECHLPQLKKNFDSSGGPTDQMVIEEVRNLPSSAKRSTHQDLNLSDDLIDPEHLKYLERAWYNYPYYEGEYVYHDIDECENPLCYYYPAYDYGEEYQHWMQLPKRSNMHEVNRYKVDDDKFEYEIYGDDTVARKELCSARDRESHSNFGRSSGNGWIDWERKMFPGYEEEEKDSTMRRLPLASHQYISEHSLDAMKYRDEMQSGRQSKLLDLSTRENIIISEDVRKQKREIREQISRQRQFLKDLMKRSVRQSRKHFHCSENTLPMMRTYDMIVFY